jgi:hypothetical protein
MRKILFIALIVATFTSCKKSETNTNTTTTTPTPVDNGPLGGSYNFKSSLVVSYDTIIEPAVIGQPAFEIANITTYTSTVTSGKITITKTNIKSEGLINTYSVVKTGTKKNLSTGAISNLTYLPYNDTRGTSNTSHNSDYTFSVPGSQMSINNAQYLFLPAFQIQPVDKKYNYTFASNDLTVSFEYYSAANRTKTSTTSVFTKN